MLSIGEGVPSSLANCDGCHAVCLGFGPRGNKMDFDFFGTLDMPMTMIVLRYGSEEVLTMPQLEH